AAAELAGRGIPVVLVEKSDRLGGQLNRWNQVFPTEQAADELVEKLQTELRSNSLVEILVNCQVTAVSGFVGSFKVTIEGPLGPGGSTISAKATIGAIVMAAGFRPYVPREGEFLYKKDPGVVTMPEFIELMRQNSGQSDRLVHQGREIRSVAF
ncbi:heterodisulfide reductase iron-sulfur subunit A, partial [mine drainage metagenome]